MTSLGNSGLAIAAHPTGRLAWCLTEEVILAALGEPEVAETLVGIASYNASLPLLHSNRISARIAEQGNFTHVANSDAHLLSMVGMGATYFPGKSVGDLRLALENGWTQVIIQPRPWHFFLNYAKQQILRQIGLAHWSPPMPGGPIALRRLPQPSNG